MSLLSCGTKHLAVNRSLPIPSLPRTVFLRAFGAFLFVLCLSGCARLSLVPYQDAYRLAEIEETAKLTDKLYFSIASDTSGAPTVSDFAEAQAHYIEIRAQIEGLRRSYADRKKAEDFLLLCDNAEEVLNNNVAAHRLNNPMASANLADILRLQMQAALNALRRAEMGLPEKDE